MNNVITFPARHAANKSGATELNTLRDKRIGDSITFHDGKVAYITGERHKRDGSRDLLVTGMGDRHWIPDTAYIASPEHFA